MKKSLLFLSALTASTLFFGCPGPDDESADATSLTLTAPQAYLAPGLTMTVTATVKPDGFPVTFSSDNVGVASVSDKGVVSGVSEGTASITATAGTKKASAAVTVVPYTSVSIADLAEGEYTIPYGTTRQLTLQWEPAGISVSPSIVKWVSSNPEAFPVDETGLVTSNSETESAEIHAEIYDGLLITKAVFVSGDEAPPVPTPTVENLRAFTGDGRYTIYWDAVENAESYRLYYTTEATKPAEPTETLTEETSFYVDTAENGQTINIWVEAVVAGTVQLDDPAHTTLTVGYSENDNQTITVGETEYTLDREVDFREGTFEQKWPTSETLYSVDSATGVLTQKGGSSSSGDGYEATTDGSGANSRLIWTPPADVLPISQYSYIEVELKTSQPSGTPGFWVVLNHNNIISYELVHYDNKPSGWFLSYGGEWRSNGKNQKFHAGKSVTLPDQGDIHKFGIYFPENTPSKIRLYADRNTDSPYYTKDAYDASEQSSGPETWTENAPTYFEFIFGAANCTDYTAEISKIRYYKASN